MVIMRVEVATTDETRNTPFDHLGDVRVVGAGEKLPSSSSSLWHHVQKPQVEKEAARQRFGVPKVECVRTLKDNRNKHQQPCIG